MIKWELVKRKICDLREHPKNARILTKEQAVHLSKSLNKFGLADKPIINRDNTIIGGHQRIKILQEMGLDEVECLIPETLLSQDDTDELNLYLNHAQGEYDYDILANYWDEEVLYGCGFTQEELGMAEFEKLEEAPKKKKLKMCPKCGNEF